MSSTFFYSALIGLIATGIDLLTLTLLIEYGNWSAEYANWPALFLGATIHFLGCRTLVFRQTRGGFFSQLAMFSVTESAAFGLNGLLFHIWVNFTSVNYSLARVASTALVFVGFSYPLWKRIFAQKRYETAMNLTL